MNTQQNSEGVLEHSVEKLVPAHIKVIKWLLYAATAVFVIIGMTGGWVWLIPTVGTLAWAWYFNNNTRVVYEYEYFNGTLDVDAVYNERKRKRFGSFDLHELMILAPEGDERLEEYDKKTSGGVYKSHGRMTYDITTHDWQNEDQRYVMFVKEGSRVAKVTFEPSREMLAAFRRLMPRAVFLREEA
jgi:hypothetical protein